MRTLSTTAHRHAPTGSHCSELNACSEGQQGLWVNANHLSILHALLGNGATSANENSAVAVELLVAQTSSAAALHAISSYNIDAGALGSEHKASVHGEEDVVSHLTKVHGNDVTWCLCTKADGTCFLGVVVGKVYELR